jgi:glycosyltransferase involved in cell wall biosynthesis
LNRLKQSLDREGILDPRERTVILKRLFLFEQDFNTLRMAEVYRMADAYLDTAQSQSHSLPVLEAMASGLPVRSASVSNS